MTPEELLQCQSNAPVHCADGKFGLLIRWWGHKAGVQVPGELGIREIEVARLNHVGGGALEER